MRIHLYSVKDEAEKIAKTLTELAVISGYARDMDQIGTEKTEFLLETNDSELIKNVNYMYVEELGRYYYIGDKKARVNKLWLIPGYVDALMSFKDQVFNCEGILARSATKGDYYIQDNKDIQYQNPHIVIKTFTSIGSGYSLVLTTI